MLQLAAWWSFPVFASPAHPEEKNIDDFLQALLERFRLSVGGLYDVPLESLLLWFRERLWLALAEISFLHFLWMNEVKKGARKFHWPRSFEVS